MVKTTSVLARHTARPQFGGYAYQVQQALLQLFRLAEGYSIGIEVLDDIHVERRSATSALVQVKNNERGTRKLGDRSEELWKTIGIWAEAIGDGSLDLSTIDRLILITRAKTVPGSFPSMIVAKKPINEVMAKLRTLAPPTAKDARSGYDLVLNLAEDQIEALLSRLEIFSSQPSMRELHDIARAYLRKLGFPEHSFDAAIREFYGWLWEQVLLTIEEPGGILIREGAFYEATVAIRDNYSAERLPLRYAEVEESDISHVELSGQGNAIYIRQLEMIGAPETMKRQAVLAYFRAASERADWVSQGNVLPSDLRRFDTELVERWQPKFSLMCCQITKRASARALRDKGLRHYVEIQSECIPVRGQSVPIYLTRGSYHLLADVRKVGWHARFAEMLI
jgi:ABC-3C protein